MKTFVRLAGIAVALVALSVSTSTISRGRDAVDLPSVLSDQQFWRLTKDLSEPEGFFDSDNLVSNEDTFQSVIPELVATVPRGGVYLGVGPDQNFTYIVATAPRLSFITDIRRGNLRVHLMYKALVELSADRADFLSRLFARRRPAGLGPASTADDLLRVYRGVAPDRELFDHTLRALLLRLTRDHGFSLEAQDEPGIAAVYGEFFSGGPDLKFVSSRGGNWYPSYADLQTATDARGASWSYLSTEERFQSLKTLEHANAIVPVVGNFAGPHALRAIGAYVKSQGATVSVFYASNVERYLFQDGLWDAFAGNLAALPMADTSVFIRSCFDSCSSPTGSRAVSLLDSLAGLVVDARARRIESYRDVLQRSISRGR